MNAANRPAIGPQPDPHLHDYDSLSPVGLLLATALLELGQRHPTVCRLGPAADHLGRNPEHGRGCDAAGAAGGGGGEGRRPPGRRRGVQQDNAVRPLAPDAQLS